LKTARIELFGVCLAIETDHPEFLRAVWLRLPSPPKAGLRPSVARRYTLRPAGTGRSGWMLLRGLRKPVFAADLGAAADLLVDDAERLIAHRATDLVFVHAGAVVWRGRAILLPGRSGAGKSELVAALLRAGARYLSDEFAVIDTHGLVHPYPRRLALRREGGFERPAPEAFGARAARTPVPVAIVALLRYRGGAAYRVRAISRGAAVLALLANTLAARKRLDLARVACVAVAADSDCLRGTRGSAEEAARRLMSEDRLSAGSRGGGRSRQAARPKRRGPSKGSRSARHEGAAG